MGADRDAKRQILNEHDPYDNGSSIVCGCGRSFPPGKAVHLSNWSAHVADLLDTIGA
jgi:hypothetical protein